MEDRLSDKYRNISGTILVINDLNYLEIGINSVIDLSLFSDNFLNKSRGLREHIALKNLVPDESGVQTQQIDPNLFKVNNQFDDNFIKQLAKEVRDQTEKGNSQPNIDIEIIKTIAEEIGKEISNNIKSQQSSITENSFQEILKQIEYKNQEINNNEYEQNIINSSIERMQQALTEKYPQDSQKPPQISEENIDSDEDFTSDLKNILNKKGGQ